MIRRFINKLRKNERGAAAVEFAIVAFLLITLLFGIIEFGWIFNGYITLTGAAREGARLAVVNEEEIIIKKAVRDHAAIFQLGDDDIIIEPGAPGTETIVTVYGKLPLIIGFIPFIDNPLNLEAKANMRQES